ncbi:MAG TPA: CHAD domain-containing protein [Woeseiaceae bacterium]|nr:CHAD domain-containing protein [Woeseiaceae bacterium]
MHEIEAKFIVRRPGQIDRALCVLEANGFAIAPRGAARHADAYYDTVDWSLLTAGWACRVRRHHGHAEVTLKSLDDADGTVLVRSEISQPLKGHVEPAPLCIPAGPVREKLDGILGDKPLVELFRVSARRTVYDLEETAVRKTGATSLRLELDVDECRIEAEKATEKATGVLEFTELELESKTGCAADLESVAALLHDEAGLTRARFSKFERGLQAAGLEIDELLAPPQASAISESDPVLALLYHYLGEQFAVIRRQHPRALEGVDPEGVHQMRVAMRRTRAVMKSFGDILGDDVVSRFNSELRWLARNLGRARDADVTARDARATGDADAGHYEQFLAEETVSAYEHLVDILQSHRCEALEAELRRFIAAGPTSAMQEKFGGLSVADCARQFIRSALRQLLAHGDAIGPDSPAEQLHKLRIEAKRFRYLLDFFSTVQPDRWVQTTEAVKKLQDVLGEHQDAVTAQERLTDYAASVPLDEAHRDKLVVTGRLLQKEEERMAACRQQFSETWSEFKRLVA